MVMRIKNIVFDFGGVLIDWNPRYLYRFLFDNEEVMELFLQEVCNASWNRELDAGKLFDVAIRERIEQFPQYKKQILKYQSHWLEMIGGEIKQNTTLIDILNQNYQLYGLTNWSAETFPLVYNEYAFFKKLEGIVVSGEEQIAKPDERIFKLLLERYKLNAEETLFIDDNKDNIETANSLGFKSIHLEPGVNLYTELQKLGVVPSRPIVKSISVLRYSANIKS